MKDMNQTHTTGPWTVEEPHGYTGHPYAVAANEGHEYTCFIVQRADMKANARLIASAHELLEALRTLASVSSDNIDDYPDTQLYRMVQDAVAKAGVAIAKATGDTQ